MPTLYYKLEVSGPTQGTAPSDEYLYIDSLQTYTRKYDGHYDSVNDDVYFEMRISAVSWQEPEDYETATYEVDHGPNDHGSRRSWQTIFVDDPASIDFPPDMEVVGTDYGLTGIGKFLNTFKTAFGFQNTRFDFSTGFVGSLSWGDFKASVGDNLFTIASNAAKAAGLANWATAIGNAGILNTLLRGNAERGMDLLDTALRNFDNPNFDAAQLDREVDTYLRDVQDRTSQALIDVTMFPGDPVAESIADSILGGARFIGRVLRDGSVPVSLDVVQLGLEVQVGGVTLSAEFVGTVESEFVIDGSGSSILRGNGGNDRILGGDGQDFLTGDSGSDYLHGGNGHDVLLGGDSPDWMTGGDGNDTYVVEDSFDVVNETNAAAAGGIDAVVSFIRYYTLGSNVENGQIASVGPADMTGNALDNLIFAGRGDNRVDGTTGNDTVNYGGAWSGVTVSLGATGPQSTGGSGTDTLVDIENVTGSFHDDRLTGNGSANRLNGAHGADRLNGGGGPDFMEGGDGDDEYFLDNPGDVVSEFSAASTGGVDLVHARVDYVLPANVENGHAAAPGDIDLAGNAGGNLLYAGTGNNLLDGRSGADTVDYSLGTSGSAGVTIDLANGRATGASGSDILVSIEHAVGSPNADRLIGNASGNHLDGGAGADSLQGGDGNDSYHVQDNGDTVTEPDADGGIDTVYTTAPDFTLGANVENGRIATAGTANLSGNGAANSLHAGSGNNVLNGGGGVDTVNYMEGVSGTTGVTVDLRNTANQSTGGSGTDRLIGVENVTGSPNDDQLTGNGLGNVLVGGAGRDTLDGGTGIDTMKGGPGDDSYRVREAGDEVSEAATGDGGVDLVISQLGAYTLPGAVENGRVASAGSLTGNAADNRLYAGAGDNLLDGGAGFDTVSYQYGTAGTGGVTVRLGTTAPQATGASGTDTLLRVEALAGSAGNDRLTGDGAANSLLGSLGDDTLDGGAGSDLMAGGDGADRYYVRDAGDVVGELNADRVTGGTDIVYSSLSSYVLPANIENGRIVSTGLGDLSGNLLDNVLYAGAGNNVFNGDLGADTVTYAMADSRTAGVVVNLVEAGPQDTGGSGLDAFLNIENLVGSSLSDNLAGSNGANVIQGGLGNDTLHGANNFFATAVDLGDTLEGGAGADLMYGVAGIDVYRIGTEGQSGSVATLQGGPRVVTTGVVFDFSATGGTDLIGWSGDRLDLDFLQYRGSLSGVTYDGILSGDAWSVRGTYNAATQSFGVDTVSGLDTLVLWRHVGDGPGQEQSVVLLGFTAFSSADLV